jgi:hypothetical protein
VCVRGSGYFAHLFHITWSLLRSSFFVVVLGAGLAVIRVPLSLEGTRLCAGIWGGKLDRGERWTGRSDGGRVGRDDRGAEAGRFQD